MKKIRVLHLIAATTALVAFAQAEAADGCLPLSSNDFGKPYHTTADIPYVGWDPEASSFSAVSQRFYLGGIEKRHAIPKHFGQGFCLSNIRSYQRATLDWHYFIRISAWELSIKTMIYPGYHPSAPFEYRLELGQIPPEFTNKIHPRLYSSDSVPFIKADRLEDLFTVHTFDFDALFKCSKGWDRMCSNYRKDLDGRPIKLIDTAKIPELAQIIQEPIAALIEECKSWALATHRRLSATLGSDRVLRASCGLAAPLDDYNYHFVLGTVEFMATDGRPARATSAESAILP